MLNIFPTMFLSLFAHALLRIFIGCIFLYLGWRHLVRDRAGLQATLSAHWPRMAPYIVRYLGVLEIVIGGMILAGSFTQIAAVTAIVLSIKMLMLRRHFAHPSIPQPLFYILLLGTCASLFITGAGVFAFDLPL